MKTLEEIRSAIMKNPEALLSYKEEKDALVKEMIGREREKAEYRNEENQNATQHNSSRQNVPPAVTA